ncbi:MAG TPA: hypothetical protein VLL08_23400 [Kineosporiaceae bacterium]|nr:hypothetical protein [Kineosporiaceae bacterium]
MSTITITFDPDDPSDVAHVRSILDRLSATQAPITIDPDTLRQKVIALLRGYGTKRTEYIRQVAQAAPAAADYDDLVAIVGSPKAVGGTHSAIERAWRAKGMNGPFIATDDLGGASMDADLAGIVLQVLHDVIDEPNPLVAASF